jgi:hypothetical protein
MNVSVTGCMNLHTRDKHTYILCQILEDNLYVIIILDILFPFSGLVCMLPVNTVQFLGRDRC